MNTSFTHLVEIFFLKLRYNLRSEVSRTYLGYAWWVLEPALLVAVLYLVFGVFYGRTGGDFLVFLTLGKVPFLWFSKSVTTCTNSLHGGRGLMAQVAIPKAFFPMLVLFQALIKQIFVFALMFAYIMVMGMELGWVWLSFLFVAVVQFLLTILCGLAVAAITAFVLDFRFLVGTIMIALMFASGIMFDYRQFILPQHQALFLLNPVALLLKNYRQVLMDNQQPDWMALMVLAAISIIGIYAMLVLYRRLDNVFTRMTVH